MRGVTGFVLLLTAFAAAAEVSQEGVRKIHFIQDDAQDYMVSKIYSLKFVQANDVMPFLMSIVMRYNMNSTVNCVEYGADNAQLLTVTCPVKLMPYVDDFVKKIDRDIRIDGKIPGDIIRGSGITRAVYRPKYRSGAVLLNVLNETIIGEGPWSSVYAWDKNSNQIYWKDNTSNTQYVFEFLSYLDRPAPQVTLNFQLYEVRESDLTDVGIEYLAWKNGPGLNLFETAWNSFSISSAGTAAIQAASGPVGGFLFAPQFDASFIRLLAQSGKAEIRNSGTLTVSNSQSKDAELYFAPEFQNITKSANDQMTVASSSLNTDTSQYYQVYVKVSDPVVNLHCGTPQPGYPASESFSVPPYRPGDYCKYPGTVCFHCNIQSANVVERNNLGAELIESSKVETDSIVALDREVILGEWDKMQDVEQQIGVPYLMEIPVLKYLFSTTTTQKEKTRVYLTVKASMLSTASSGDFRPGDLLRFK